MSESLEKISLLGIAGVSAVACFSGGMMRGLTDAWNVYFEYRDLATYGPTLFVTTAMGLYGGMVGYEEVRNKPPLENPVAFASAAGAISAATAGILGAYNTYLCYLLGYAIVNYYQ